MNSPQEQARIGVYIHIPYCRTKCPYCDFISLPIAGAVPAGYLEALRQEIRTDTTEAKVSSVFIGGGTPSLLSPRQLDELLDALEKRFTLVDPEITLEANPDDVTSELVQAWRDVGINRVSLGVQSFDDAVLRYLGRRHDAARARRACEEVAEVFENWNLDLIFGAPPVGAWPETLQKALALAPPHLAVYGLTYEAGTPFEARRKEALEEDAALCLYQEAEEALQDYDHYEISNYARPGHHSRHNLIYWRNESYLGFGAGAYGYVNGVRARNHPVVEAYLAAPGEKQEALVLDAREIRIETVIQHLRLKAGLSRAAYLERFGSEVRTDFPAALAELSQRGLVAITPDRIRPTPKGFYLNNEIGLALVEGAG